MNHGNAIRPEKPEDRSAIRSLVERAFAPMPFSDGSEPDLVDRLRERGELALSLVATGEREEVVGHVAFSPATVEGRACGWLQMAPVSVCPARQRQGIGSALIEAGIGELRRRGASGVAVVGDPAYYERFGFAAIEGLAPASQHDARYFRAMVLAGEVPQGILRYASAFG